MCLKHLPRDAGITSEDGRVTHYYHGGNVPWQRVINSKGMISSR
ncbi:MAG: hypothetical protein INR71_01990 [Terriglobus roseus]|nr:hypothetical protein [Terriglobus roseus]